MLVYINDMLSSGYIAGLFPNEDVTAMAGNLRQEAKGLGIVETPGNLMQYWLDTLKSNMHTILCFSPVGDDFRTRARKFPGLISCAMIDYFHAWPEEALYSVGMRYLKDTPFASEELRSSIAQNMADVHMSIKDASRLFLEIERRQVFTTPKSFLEFKDYYNKLLKEKRLFIKNKIDRLEKGLDIISSTNEQVQVIKEEVSEIAVMVEKETVETDILIKKVGKEAAVADKEKAIAEKQAVETNKITEDALATKAKADEALSEALPALDKAKAAVGGLQPQDISDMTKIGNPVQAVCVTIILLMILIWEWKIKIKKIDFTDIEALRKIYKQGLPRLKPPGNFLKFVTAWSGK